LICACSPPGAGDVSTLASSDLRLGNADGDSRFNGLSAHCARQIEHLLFLKAIVETGRLRV